MRDTRRARTVLGVLLVVAMVVMTVDDRAGDASPLNWLRVAASSVFSPVEHAGGSVITPMGEFFSAVTGAVDAQHRIKELQEENERLKEQLAAQRLDRARSAELRELLGLAGRGQYTIVTGQVVARRGVPGFEDTVEIDVGTRDGVRSEMTVVNGHGLVGRVVRAGPATSTVLLLSDPASSVGARLEGRKEIGVVQGTGQRGRRVRFRLLDTEARLKVGARLVSFGSKRGTPYVPGVPIGVIERVEATPGELTRTAYARPYADLSALDVVGVVVKGPKRDPRDAVLPPPPVKRSEASGRPVTSRRPDTSDRPAVSRRPEVSDRPAVSRGPETSEHPATSRRPEVSERPATSRRPDTSGNDVGDRPARPRRTEAPARDGSAADRGDGAGRATGRADRREDGNPRNGQEVPRR